jgi:hypothetical protein
MMTRVLFLFLLVSSFAFCTSSIPEKPSGWDEWTFDEKIAWRGQHLDPRIPYATYADKIKVKEIVGNSILTAKLLRATDNLRLISTRGLPRSYLMKPNNASSRGLLIIDGMILARMKRDCNFVPVAAKDRTLRLYARHWLSTPFNPHTEFQYGLIKPMILFEEYLEDITLDIELFCFNGEVKLIEVLFTDSYKNNPVISFYDRNWNLLQTTHPVHEVKNTPIDRPLCLDELFAFAKQFTQDIDQVRVDFFLNGKDPYFGEFTFTTGTKVVPETFQQMLGRCWKYPEVN